MGRAPTPPPGRFSLQIIRLTKHELTDRGQSGRWLAEQTSLSATYLRERLDASRPFNTNDLAEIAELFGYTPDEFAREAIARDRPKLSVIPGDKTVPGEVIDLETVDLDQYDAAAHTTPDTPENPTP